MSRPEVVREALDGSGPRRAAAIARADDAAIKADLRARTDEAIAAGVFGAPTFVITVDAGEPQLFCGPEHRLDFVEKALAGWRPEDRRRRGGVVSELSFYFDFSSPFAYLGATQVEAIAARHGATLLLRPFLLGALFKAIGTPNVPILAMPPPKQKHYRDDIYRSADHYGAPFRFPTRFPINSVKALRLFQALSVRRSASRPPPDLSRATWFDDRDLSDERVLAEVLAAIGIDPGPVAAEAQTDAAKARLRAATDEAEAIGVCGAPCFLVKTLGRPALRAGSGRPTDEGRLFWGQDRIVFVERALAGWVPRGETPGSSAG